MIGWYKLDENKQVVPCSVNEFWEWEKIGDPRRVGLTQIKDCKISTMFLGLDHGWSNELPVVFETMVFEGPLDGEMDRCCTWKDALEMHERMCKKVLEEMK